MKHTVKEIRAMLEMLPDEMSVEFVPITMAYTGCVKPLRFGEIFFYNEAGQHAIPSEKDARLVVHLNEEA